MTAGARRPPAARALVAALAAIAATVAGPAPAVAAPDAPDVAAEASIVVDAESGAVIAAEDAGARRPIASTTKLMTALLTLERAEPDEVFTAAGYDPAPVESQIGLQPGERMAVRDLLVALLLESANDAAVTLAEGIAGSVDAFVADMNARAQRLDLDDTSYANPIGFDDPDNYSTASELAQLARRLMAEPRFRDIVEEPSLPLESGAVPRIVENRNTLVGEEPLVDGVKTGHTLGAGHVLVGSASDADHRVIGVVLGAPSEADRDAATLELLRFGLDQLVDRRVLRAGEPVARAPVSDEAGESVPLAPARSATATVIRGKGVETRVRAPAALEGPLDEGERVGSVQILQNGEQARRVALVTAEAVPAPDLVAQVTGGLVDWVWIAAGVAILMLVAAAIIVARARRQRAGASA
jgi:D-alanyl-D-alanine carboxypeptidase (penicillin-binding protein 5/6)